MLLSIATLANWEDTVGEYMLTLEPVQKETFTKGIPLSLLLMKEAITWHLEASETGQEEKRKSLKKDLVMVEKKLAEVKK